MNVTKARLAFAGTPELAVHCLDALVSEPAFEIAVVLTQPDRRAGRGQAVRASPVKTKALAHGLTVWQPDDLRDDQTIEQFQRLGLDLLVVAAYGKILPRRILETPRLGCVNVHASLLPRWRGAAPIQRAILAGDTVTGITIMQVVEELDAGPILSQASCPIEPRDTSATLYEWLSALGAETLLSTLPDLLRGELTPIAQDPAKVTYANKIEKSEAMIDWRAQAAAIERQIRAFNPKPLARTRLFGRDLRIWEAAVVRTETPASPGTVCHVGREGIDIATGTDLLRLTRIQLPGKRPITACDFVNANPNLIKR